MEVLRLNVAAAFSGQDCAAAALKTRARLYTLQALSPLHLRLLPRKPLRKPNLQQPHVRRSTARARGIVHTSVARRCPIIG